MGIYLVMKNNMKKSLQHKKLIAITFLLPLAICLLVGSVEFGKPTLRVGILSGEMSGTDRKALTEVYHLIRDSKNINVAWAEEERLNTDLISGKFHLVMDYRGSHSMGEFELLSLRNQGRMEVMKTSLIKAVQNHEELLFQGFTEEKLDDTQKLMAILLTLTIIISTLHGSGIIHDNNNGTHIRFRFSGRSRWSYLTGYILYNFILTYLQVLLCEVMMGLILREFTLTIGKGIMLAVAISLIATVLATAISRISRSELQAGVLSSSLAAVASILGGTFVAVEHMPGLLKLLSYASPVRWITLLVG